jgi:long-chain acyl-CoA synthetase
VMENNEHIHAAMWAARRSGLHYTLVNTQLRAAEIAYVVDDSGAKAVISSLAMRAVCQQLSESLPRGLPPVALMADAELEEWQRYPVSAIAVLRTAVIAQRRREVVQAGSTSTRGVEIGRPGMGRTDRHARHPERGDKDPIQQATPPRPGELQARLRFC